MSEKKVNTTESIKAAQVTDAELQKMTEAAAKALGSAKKVKVSIPAALQKSVGPTVPFGINGAIIVIPVDGEDYEVPEPYGALVKEYLKTVQM